MNNNLRYHFMYTMKDAYGETIVQMMDFKGARTVKFRLSEIDQFGDEVLRQDVYKQMDRIKNPGFLYTGGKK